MKGETRAYLGMAQRDQNLFDTPFVGFYLRITMKGNERNTSFGVVQNLNVAQRRCCTFRLDTKRLENCLLSCPARSKR